ncbi:hypothetical protein QBC35DRAFT_438595 [Podospora australis]|uniref:C2H2-type domain-containing protein n=1 Tax=Podospora australis TaxID=1536484 RepID=A0AAN6WPL2_9PEZI|nr:hypothetical protein QBC35DRAFT_438595 [Podospora australis]
MATGGDRGKSTETSTSATRPGISGTGDKDKPRPIFKMKRTGVSGPSPGLFASPAQSAARVKPSTPRAPPSTELPASTTTATATSISPGRNSASHDTPELDSRARNSGTTTTRVINTTHTSPTKPKKTATAGDSEFFTTNESTPVAGMSPTFGGAVKSAKKGQGALDENTVPLDVQKIFSSALDDKPYRTFVDPDDGRPIATYGALIPPGYQKNNDEEFPWICPVRSCRKLFTTIFGLAKHSNMSHRATSLHDNLDGTFTDLGHYVDAVHGDGFHGGGYSKPPIIISKGHRSLKESPMAESDWQHARERAEATKRTSSGLGVGGGARKMLTEQLDSGSDSEQQPALAQRAPTTNYRRGGPGASKQLRSSTSTSTSNPTPAASTETVATELNLTQVDNTRTYKMFPDETGQLADMCGALLPKGYKCSTLVKDRPWICPVRSCRRLFKSRDTIGYHFRRTHRGDQLNDNLDGTFSTVMKAANGTVRANTVPAAVVSRGVMDSDKEEPIVEPKLPTYPTTSSKYVVWVPVSAAAAAASGFEVEEEDQDVDNDQSSQTVSLRPRRSATNGVYQEISTTSKRSRAVDEDGDGVLPAEEEPEPKRSRTVSTKNSGGSRSAGQPKQVAYTSGIVVPQEVLQMEDWEIDDGRIAVTTGDGPETIAFSGAYMSSNQNVQVHEDVSYLTTTINSGSTYHFRPEENKLRICSLARGKLRVNIGEEPEFTIGAHGMFKVKPGQAASVLNRCYIDVVLQITSLDLE